MDARKVNELCRQIERTYRDDTNQRNVRLGCATTEEVFTTQDVQAWHRGHVLEVP